MSMTSISLLLLLSFLACGVASAILIGKMTPILEELKQDPSLIESLGALALSGDGGPSIWPGHRFLVRREYARLGNARLTELGDWWLSVYGVTVAIALGMIAVMVLGR